MLFQRVLQCLSATPICCGTQIYKVVCLQVLAQALGGLVQPNPSGTFVLAGFTQSTAISDALERDLEALLLLIDLGRCAPAMLCSSWVLAVSAFSP